MTLAPADWDKQSQCADWTVKDVAAHMLVIPTIPKGKVFRAFVGSGFNLNKMNAKWIKQLTAEATDTDWSTGSGPTVSGTSKKLLMAMAGRPSAVAALTGDGVATLQSR